jgi:replicative DNA helicase
MSGKNPPYDEQAEAALVGAMLVDPSVIGAVEQSCVPSDLYVPRYRALYAVMRTMWADGEVIDPVTVSGSLRASGDLETVGGDAGLMGIMSSGGMTANAAGYATRIAECAAYRRLIQVCNEASDVAWDQSQPANDLAEWLGQAAADSAAPVAAELPDDLWQMDEFLDRPQSARPEWVIPGLARVGWRVMVVAAEGVGKTVLFRQIGLAAAQGVHPLHYQRIAPCRTLIVDLENPDDSIMDVCQPIRAQAQAKVRDDYDADRAWLWHRPGGINLRKRKDRAELEAVIAHVQPTLVCLGPIYKAYRVEARESDELAGAEVMAVFDDLRTRYGFALMLEHHAPKGQGGSRDLMPYGSSLWLRWPEIGLKLTPKDDTNEVMTVGRWRGDRLENAWPVELERSKPWPWQGIWPTGTFSDPNAHRRSNEAADQFRVQAAGYGVEDDF